MKHIEGNYYEHEGELYKKLKGTPRGYHIITEEGKQGWLRLKCTDSTPVQNVQDTLDEAVEPSCTESTPEALCTESTAVQGVQCTESTKHYIKHINIEEEYLLGAYGINK